MRHEWHHLIDKLRLRWTRGLGFVLARGRKGHEALDREQRSLGLLKTAAAAANVVFNAAASERGTG
jgi:hypothetical protein